MLVSTESTLELIETVIDDPALRFIAKNIVEPFWRKLVEEDKRLFGKVKKVISSPKPRVFTNAGKRKSVVVIQRGADFNVYAKTRDAYRRAMRDIFERNFEAGIIFPDEEMKRAWEHWSEGKPYIFVHAPFFAWKSGVEAGFEPIWNKDIDEKKKRRKMRMGDARTWYITGKPRFRKFIRHPCRIIERGDELLPLIRKGVEYGEGAKDYLKACLLLGPSFVCEVDGEPVCWAGTHLSGTMGMIYTPPEHRRKGYAQSLAALQIDYMLEHFGIAVAHVVYGNKASENLLKGFGAVHTKGTVTWRSLTWPKRMWKKLKRG